MLSHLSSVISCCSRYSNGAKTTGTLSRGKSRRRVCTKVSMLSLDTPTSSSEPWSRWERRRWSTSMATSPNPPSSPELKSVSEKRERKEEYECECVFVCQQVCLSTETLTEHTRIWSDKFRKFTFQVLGSWKECTYVIEHTYCMYNNTCCIYCTCSLPRLCKSESVEFISPRAKTTSWTRVNLRTLATWLNNCCEGRKLWIEKNV